MPYDSGKMIAVGWRHKLDNQDINKNGENVKGYLIFRSEDGKNFEMIGNLAFGITDTQTEALWRANGIKHPSYGRIYYSDNVDEDNKDYFYKVKVIAPSDSVWQSVDMWAAGDTSYVPVPNRKEYFTRAEVKADTILFREINADEKKYEQRMVEYGDTVWKEAEYDSTIKPVPDKKGYYFKIIKGETKETYRIDSGKAYKLKVTENYSSFSDIVKANASIQYWDWSKMNILILSILFSAVLLFYINRAKKGTNLFVRRIAGLSEVDEAIGRATEMGRPILYISGLSTIGDIATMAAINILGEVAKRTAEYSTPLIVPAYDVIVLQVEIEVLKEAYLHAGRPDAFNSEVKAFFLTDSQFGYAAAVDGIMVREKPAANFYMGMFFAESLIMTETGAAEGAIQIAGTDAVTQIPFFITSCDYTLMGEELYAASAYLSREARLLGNLKAVDFIKLVFMISITLGVITTTIGWNGLAYIFNTVICIFPQ
ncbi:MAG: hypothetical protein JXA60_00060 [Candidatus Coatesbacteria bacterium]|nr:hypothetical protein [Candidatus Coatesbacteria bacterium]